MSSHPLEQNRELPAAPPGFSLNSRSVPAQTLNNLNGMTTGHLGPHFQQYPNGNAPAYSQSSMPSATNSGFGNLQVTHLQQIPEQNSDQATRHQTILNLSNALSGANQQNQKLTDYALQSAITIQSLTRELAEYKQRAAGFEARLAEAYALLDQSNNDLFIARKEFDSLGSKYHDQRNKLQKLQRERQA